MPKESLQQFRMMQDMQIAKSKISHKYKRLGTVKPSASDSAPVWFDPVNERFNIDQIPSDLKKVFKDAGLKPRDLQRSGTSKQIFETLRQSGIGTYNELENQKKKKHPPWYDPVSETIRIKDLPD